MAVRQARDGRGIRVIIADDHPVYRDGLAAVLAQHPDLELVGQAENGAAAIELFRSERPDVALMDLSMPVMGGAESTSKIVAEFPAARIIILTTYHGDADIQGALEAGARGYLLKDVLRNEVADAVRTVFHNGWVLPDAVAQRLARVFPRAQLTEREVEVLRFMAKGYRNKEIAQAVSRADATVKVHVQHILEKLGARDRTEAVVIAIQRGIIHLD